MRWLPTWNEARGRCRGCLLIGMLCLCPARSSIVRCPGRRRLRRIGTCGCTRISRCRCLPTGVARGRQRPALRRPVIGRVHSCCAGCCCRTVGARCCRRRARLRCCNWLGSHDRRLPRRSIARAAVVGRCGSRGCRRRRLRRLRTTDSSRARWWRCHYAQGWLRRSAGIRTGMRSGCCTATLHTAPRLQRQMIAHACRVRDAGDRDRVQSSGLSRKDRPASSPVSLAGYLCERRPPDQR